MRWVNKYLRISFILWIAFVFLFANFEFLHSHKFAIAIYFNNDLGAEQFFVNSHRIYFGLQKCLLEIFVKSLQIGFFFGNKGIFFDSLFLDHSIRIFNFPLLQNRVQLPITRAPPVFFS